MASEQTAVVLERSAAHKVLKLVGGMTGCEGVVRKRRAAEVAEFTQRQEPRSVGIIHRAR